MRIFISSLITGMEPYRAAAVSAIRSLGHEPVMAEDFRAQPVSPQVACLRGVRESQAVVLILGAEYGAKQNSGLSATHEEYREARDSRPVFAFAQRGVQHGADQAAFVEEAGTWGGGLYRDGFSSPEELQQQITQSIHQWELATQAGPVDEKALLEQAINRIPDEPHGYVRSGHELILSIASGPRQPVLRPSQIDKKTLHETVLQAALFGPQKIFTPDRPNVVQIKDDQLFITHGENSRVVMSGEGDILLQLTIKQASGGIGGMVVIEEHVTETMVAALRYAAWLLDHVDQTQRLTHVALAATISNNDHLVWRSVTEQRDNPDSYSMGFGHKNREPVHLSPPSRPRPALVHQQTELVEDLVTLLRRQFQGNR